MALQAQPSARAASINELDVLLYLRPHAQEQVTIWRAAGSRAAQSPHAQRLVHARACTRR